MLQCTTKNIFTKGGYNNGTTKKWFITGLDIRRYGLSTPQGFRFEISYTSGIGNFFWTTNETAAYLFYKRNGHATKEVVKGFHDRLAREAYLYNLSYALDSNINLKCPEGIDYFPYQKAGIEFAMRTRNTLIADSMRLGKTIITLGLINNLDNVNKVLIICPKTAKFVWVKESKKWLINPLKTQVLNAHSQIDPDAQLYITNYDVLHIQTKLVRMDWDIVVGDEIHLASRERARRTKYFQALKAKKRLGLSGTPLLNNPIDFLTVLQWCDPLWKDFYIWKDKFATKSGVTLSLDEVKELARSTCMLRRLQAQAFESEPIERRLVPLEPTEEIKDLIGKQLKFGDFSNTSKKLGISKVPHILNYIDAYTGDNSKLVVFAYHKEVIDRLKASLGSKAKVIYGDTTEDERVKAINSFNNDTTCNVIIGSIPAMSMAIDLSKANQILFGELDWSNGMLEQAEERCSNKNQKHPVLVEYLVYENSLDERKLEKVLYKDDRCDKALDVVY